MRDDRTDIYRESHITDADNGDIGVMTRGVHSKD